MPGKRTVLKGLIGHSNSSGDQASWECDGKNLVLYAELSTVLIFITPYRRASSHSPCDSEVWNDLAHRCSLYLADNKYISA